MEPGTFRIVHARNLLVVAALSLTQVGHPELLRVATVGRKSISYYLVPHLPQIPGWHPDEATGQRNHLYALVQDGYDFNHSPAVIYGLAVPVASSRGDRTVADFLRGDVQNSKKHLPDVIVSEQAAIINGDKRKIRCVQFFPKTTGAYERIAYDLESDFFLTIAISAKTKKAFDVALPAYKGMIARYKK